MDLKLDTKDKKLLYELDLNSRQSNAGLAKKVGLSKDAVGYRIKSLEKKQIIRGYRAVIDSAKLGYSFYRILINLIDTPPQRLAEIISHLESEKNTWWIARLDGSWNFAFSAWTKTKQDFQDLYNRFKLKFKENIKQQLICPMIDYENISRKYFLEEKISPTIRKIGGESPSTKFDKTDLKILESLCKNAKTSLLEIATDLQLDSMTIHHRIKSLEKQGIIKGYQLDINFQLIKREFYSVKINLKNTSKIEEIENYIRLIPETTGLTHAIGSYDIEFDLEVENSEKYFEIIKSLEEKFQEIREIIYFRVLENHKILYMPEIE